MKEVLIEMYLTEASVRQVEDIKEVLWSTRYPYPNQARDLANQMNELKRRKRGKYNAWTA